MAQNARRVVTERPLNAEFAPGALAAPLTPIDAFFVRCHFDVPPPDAIDAIEIAGDVARPQRLDLRELRAAGPERELVVTMECAGNSRSSFEPRPPGTPWGDGAVSTARYAGVPLRRILERAEVTREATGFVFTGADRGTTRSGRSEPYARFLSREDAVHDDVLLAWEMNGTPLPPEHGAPVRLLVPGWYGMASVKWLARIEATHVPFRGFFQVDDYVFRDHPELPDDTPVTRIAPNSRVLAPAAGETVAAGEKEVSGVAWSGHGPISRVEIRFDGGDWIEAELLGDTSPYSWRRWRIRHELSEGHHEIRTRATDVRGGTQPDRAPWNGLGYVQNSIRVHRISAR
ncbi:MAG: sulfite oxidase [bacterium]